jgi:hypothetical protein
MPVSKEFQACPYNVPCATSCQPSQPTFPHRPFPTPGDDHVTKWQNTRKSKGDERQCSMPDLAWRTAGWRQDGLVALKVSGLRVLRGWRGSRMQHLRSRSGPVQIDVIHLQCRLTYSQTGYQCDIPDLQHGFTSEA